MEIRRQQCLICSSFRVLKEWKLDPVHIIEQLKLQWGLTELKGDSIRFLKDTKEIIHFICLDCEGGYWSPTIPGDPDFYESISSLYVEHRWDKKVVRERVKRSKSILDVGSGPDPIFKPFKQKIKKKFVSLDINPFVNQNNSGQYMKISDIKSLGSGSLRFENIVALHFLEHIGNPIEYFRSLSLLLDRGGSIWISVPNRDRKVRTKPFEVLDTPPHHVTSWNLNSLGNFASLLNLELVNAWASKESSNFRITHIIRKYKLSRDFSRLIFYKIPLINKDKRRGFQLLVQLKSKRTIDKNE